MTLSPVHPPTSVRGGNVFKARPKRRATRALGDSDAIVEEGEFKYEARATLEGCSKNAFMKKSFSVMSREDHPAQSNRSRKRTQMRGG